ncbi:uncharacterized protein LOC128963719 [Oppia nitens]|uniref:uncharacterized protein LOC128963719 n=1 Tax=Oppia nitens TaxID=1686743 RepID=UPI0023DCB0E7|nr:uncharacterized protein LOC128963719 [Oppia nitens]
MYDINVTSSKTFEINDNKQHLLLDRYVSLSVAQQLVAKLSDAKHQYLEFDGLVHRYSQPIVPDIVHQIMFTIHEIQFIHYISLLSVLKNHRPAVIVIHCDCNRLTGHYYERLIRRIAYTNTTLILREIKKPTHIFGKPLSRRFRDYHAGDITRITVLSQFGGIYFDNDIYVVKSLHEFRNYEMTFQLTFKDSKPSVGPQAMIVHRNARFLKIWIDSFHDYRADSWFYTGGELPGKLAQKNRNIINVISGTSFGCSSEVCPKLYAMYYPEWERDYYTIHTYIRSNYFYHHGWCMHGYHTDVLYYNETIVETVNNTFADMCRKILHWESN